MVPLERQTAAAGPRRGAQPGGPSSFFTIRQSWAWTTQQAWFGDGRDKWPWLDHRRSSRAGTRAPTARRICVCVAEHPHVEHRPQLSRPRRSRPPATGTDRGLYFAEQWQRALEVDPEFVFITGWNEWIAQRFTAARRRMRSWANRSARATHFSSTSTTEEFSRDVEPMHGGHGDNYYYQMVAGHPPLQGCAAAAQGVARDDHPHRDDFAAGATWPGRVPRRSGRYGPSQPSAAGASSGPALT